MTDRDPRRVVILVHRNDDFERAGYILHELAALWRDRGIQVTVARGRDELTDADLAILHVDLTRVPADYVSAVRRYPRVMNGRVIDISKRRISTNLLRRPGDYDGPVIVKTNRNFGGMKEALLARAGPALARYAQELRDRLPWSWRSWMPVSEYPVFESPRQVPRAVWLNPNLVVERFLPERREGRYCLRSWMFMGDRDSSTLAYSDHPIVKSRNIIRRELLTEVPAELRQLRRELGFDFGKFDYSLVDGKPVLFDANRTPSLGRLSREAFRPRAEVLAGGLAALCG
jgi:hypothetical protein